MFLLYVHINRHIFSRYHRHLNYACLVWLVNTCQHQLSVHTVIIYVLLLTGNPYPPLVPNLSDNRNLLHNVLLEEARKEQRQQQYAQTAHSLGAAAESSQDPSAWAATKPEDKETPS
jgi:hypothetical protein